jgi:hypothetical protein
MIVRGKRLETGWISLTILELAVMERSCRQIGA